MVPHLFSKTPQNPFVVRMTNQTASTNDHEVEQSLYDIRQSSQYFFTTEARSISTFSATLSTISSVFVIYIILRSIQGLSSSYHRIVFLMSFCDVIVSVGIVLGTLPMPSDVTDVYPFRGAVGNAATCSAQAFVIVGGQAFSVLSNCALNIYYVCILRHGMSEETLRRRVEPVAFIIISIWGLATCIAPLSMGLLNPRPYDPYCLVGAYPESCYKEEYDCIGRDVTEASERIVFIIVVLSLALGFFLLFMSSALIILSVYKTDRVVKKLTKEQDENNIDTGLTSAYEETKFAVKVAFLYIGAFVLTWLWPILSIMNIQPLVTLPHFWPIHDRAKLVFSPLQGFFNALIFIYQKVSSASRRSTTLTCWEALRRLIFSPHLLDSQEVIIVASLAMVERDLAYRDKNNTNAMASEDMMEEPTSSSNRPEDDPSSLYSPASIPSNFKSLETPAARLSNIMSSDGINSEIERQLKLEMRKNESKYQYYRAPTPSRFFSEGRYATGDNSAVSPPALTLAPVTSESGDVTEERGGNANGSRGTKSVFTKSSLLSGFSSIISGKSKSSKNEDDLSYEDSFKDTRL